MVVIKICKSEWFDLSQSLLGDAKPSNMDMFWPFASSECEKICTNTHGTATWIFTKCPPIVRTIPSTAQILVFLANGRVLVRDVSAADSPQPRAPLPISATFRIVGSDSIGSDHLNHGAISSEKNLIESPGDLPTSDPSSRVPPHSETERCRNFISASRNGLTSLGP